MGMDDAVRHLLMRAGQAEEMAGGVRTMAAAMRRTGLSGCAGPASDELRSQLKNQAATALQCANLADDVAGALRDHAKAVAGSWLGSGL